jgi:SET domain-containing protein
MLLVRATVHASNIHGLGCFANETIVKGKAVWIYDKRIDIRISVWELLSLPESMQEFLNMYGYAEMIQKQRVITLCGDHAKHMNHSDTPNVMQCGGNCEIGIATRHIDIGEELTCDYTEFDLGAANKLVQVMPISARI